MYILNSGKHWVQQIAMDNAQMKFALKNNASHAVNLVFCNTAPAYWDDFVAEIHNAEPDVCSVIIQSHFKDGIKHTDKPIINKNYNGSGQKVLLK